MNSKISDITLDDSPPASPSQTVDIIDNEPDDTVICISDSDDEPEPKRTRYESPGMTHRGSSKNGYTKDRMEHVLEFARHGQLRIDQLFAPSSRTKKPK